MAREYLIRICNIVKVFFAGNKVSENPELEPSRNSFSG